MFISGTCEGERCWCGQPAARKVGEEIPYDDPLPHRHNLTSYICAFHYAQLMGPYGAADVGVTLQSHNAPKNPTPLSELDDCLRIMRHLSWQCERDGVAEIARRVNLTVKCGLEENPDKRAKMQEELDSLGPVAIFDKTVYHRVVKLLSGKLADAR